MLLAALMGGTIGLDEEVDNGRGRREGSGRAIVEGHGSTILMTP